MSGHICKCRQNRISSRIEIFWNPKATAAFSHWSVYSTRRLFYLSPFSHQPPYWPSFPSICTASTRNGRCVKYWPSAGVPRFRSSYISPISDVMHERRKRGTSGLGRVKRRRPASSGFNFGFLPLAESEEMVAPTAIRFILFSLVVWVAAVLGSPLEPRGGLLQ